MNDAPNTNGAADRTMLFVHGRDFKPTADNWLDVSVATIKAAIARDCPEVLDKFADVRKQVAYYGDINNEFHTGKGRRYDPELDMGDRRNALRSLAAIDKRKNFGVHRYDRVPGKTALGEFIASTFGPVLGKLGLSKFLIALVCEDLAEYWTEESDFAEKIRSRVRNDIFAALKGDSSVMLVSHGTGCVITYDVLWELSHSDEYASQLEGRKIDGWLTLGAPLGDSMIRNRLLGAKLKGPAKYPQNVVSWYNVAAEDDYLCHDNTLADDYKEMLRQKLVSSIRDYRIYNLAVRYGKSNPHCSIGYLIHPRVAQIISNWLKRDAHELEVPQDLTSTF